MNNDHAIFVAERQERVKRYQQDHVLKNASKQFLSETLRVKYSYQFDWLGLPIIQYPQDIVAMQEIVWMTRPDLIIETGIARGGSLILSASLLALLDLTDAIDKRRNFAPSDSARKVIGVDIDIRAHNRTVIEGHPLASRILMLEGSSIDCDIVARIHELAAPYNRIMVCLDSNHTHAHVLAELEAYAPLVSVGAYCVVFDTVIEDLPAATFPERPWHCGNSPKTAVQEFLRTHPEFQLDDIIADKLLATAAQDGYLRRCA